MDNIWYRNPSKSEVIDRCGGDEKTEWPRRTDKSRTLKKHFDNDMLVTLTNKENRAGRSNAVVSASDSLLMDASQVWARTSLKSPVYFLSNKLNRICLVLVCYRKLFKDLFFNRSKLNEYKLNKRYPNKIHAIML